MPRDWRHWEPWRKAEWLLQIPLDRIEEILGWDPATLDDPRLLAASTETVRVVLKIGAHAGMLGRLRPRRTSRKSARDLPPD